MTKTVTAVVVADCNSHSSPRISTKARILLHFVSQRKGSRGRARTLFMSFSSFGLSPDRKRNLLSCFPSSSLFCCFCFFSFFYFGGRLAGLSMAHICSSSLLVFTTALGLLPPRLMDREGKTEMMAVWSVSQNQSLEGKGNVENCAAHTLLV